MEEVEDRRYKILFVCLGNICRSPAAQGIMEKILEERGMTDAVEVDSAGISGYHSGDLPDTRMRVHAQRRGLDLTHRSRRATSDDLRRFDLIVGMDDSNVDDLKELADSVEDAAKVVQMSQFFRQHRRFYCVPDPYYGGAEGFENVLDLLEDACQCIADRLENGELRAESDE